MIPFYFHPGMGKTATTTLQQSAFTKHSEILCIGKDRSTPENRRRRGYISDELFTHFTGVLNQGPSSPHPNIKEAKHALEEAIHKAGEKEIVLASWEGIANSKPRKFQQVMSNLCAVTPTVKVLFTIRNQLPWLKSSYLQSVATQFKKGNINPKTAPFAEFEEWLDLQKRRWGTLIPPTLQNIDIAAAQVGQDNVGIFCFEELLRDPEKFYREIANFFGVDSTEFIKLASGHHENPRITQPQVDLARKTNQSSQLRQLWQNRPKGENTALFNAERHGAKPEVIVSRSISDEITELSREANRVMTDKYKLDLGGYGYPV